MAYHHFSHKTCTGLMLWVACILALAGCSHTPSHKLLPSSGIQNGGVAAVQSSTLFHKVSGRYDRHDYQGALTLLDALSAQPGFRNDAGAEQYLARQRLICRHALDPRVVLTLPPTAPKLLSVTPRRADCGPRALLLVCQQANIKATLPDLTREAGTSARGTTMAGLARAARAYGFHAKGVQVNPQALSQLSGRALAWVEADHYLAVLSVRDGQATIHDPNRPNEEVIPTPQLWSRCGGILLTLSR